MLFFYGTGNSRVTTAPVLGVSCQHCQTPDALTCTVFSRYFSLFWIPVFPLGKHSVTVCQHCKQVLTSPEMPPAYRAPVQACQSQARTPLTNYALLLVFGAGVAFLMVVGLIGNLTGSAKPTAADATTEERSDDDAVEEQNDEAAVEEQSDASTSEEGLVGKRYKTKAMPGSTAYALAQVTRETPDSVYYSMTHELRGELTDAGASLALRDSLDPVLGHQGTLKRTWHYITTGQGMFRQFTVK